MTQLLGYVLCVLCTLNLSVSGIKALAASFHGESYIWLPWEDANLVTELQLEFRTGRPDALLFLAGGSPDYLLVTLEQGSIRVVMDLGSGETILGSHPGLVFNDLHWHYIHLYRNKKAIQLNINNMTTIAVSSPGQYTELNINKGLFLGSVAASSDLFYGILRAYRGCIKNVFFNGLDVLSAASLELDPLHVYEVSWECSSEFGASSQQPLSFLHNTSFVAFRQIDSYKKGQFTFDLKTRLESALLLYASGRFSNPDYIALELVNGLTYVTVNKGSGAVSFSSGARIDDAMWHQIEVIINPLSIALSVDGVRGERQMNFGESRYLDLYGYLYVGGVGIVARSVATQLHLKSLSGMNGAAGSLIGCIQNFKMNGELYGFREAEVTKGLLPECVWTFPCSSDPCISDAECEEEGYYYYNCRCSQANCYKNEGGAHGPIPTGPAHGMLHVQDLVVQEGGTSLILRNNLDIVADYPEYGIRDSGVVFRVIKHPEHGDIQVELAEPESDATIFTMADVLRNSVSYVHDGSESEMDGMDLELEFIIPDDIQDADMPGMFKQRYGLTLSVEILPWNDKPDIKLPKNSTLVLVSNTQVVITPRIIRAMDRDDPPNRLEYTIQYQHGNEIGYFEFNDGARVQARITSFTQEDINEGHIVFIHRGAASQQIRIQVSDRKDVSDARTLNIQAVPLEIDLQENTGIYVPKGSTNLILKQNLSFATNTPNQVFPVRYEVSVPPFDGEIQRQQPSNNQWAVSTTFTQQDIDDSRIRYFHYGGQTPDDFFKFKVYVSTNDENPKEYDFDVTIVQMGVTVTKNQGLHLMGTRDGHITQQELHALSFIPSHTAEKVVFSLLTLPRKGNLYLVHQRSDDSVRKRKINTNFTQADINAGKIMYRLNRALFDSIEDSFEFRVEIPGAETQVNTFDIRYEPVESEIRFINNGLSTVEGGTKMITRQDLYMESEDIFDFTYLVTDSPKHGTLQIINPNTGDSTNRNASSFTNNDIMKKKVYYKHDDSETVDDFFTFTATPIVHHTQHSGVIIQEISEFSGTFEIKISLRNDNSPKRVIKKPFQVVANRGRVVTLDDINFIDPDTDFDNSKLRYRFEKITNGEFVQTDNKSEEWREFLQEDLANGRVYFHHHGANYSKGKVVVSDGDFQIMEEFEVQVSEPYIRIMNNTGIAVNKGQNVTISTYNISIDSNLDGLDKEFKFTITDPPLHGLIKKNTNERNRFNLADLKKGHVKYEHDNTEFIDDMFKFSVRYDDTQAEATVQVKILLSSHQLPLSIVHNRMTPVEELSQVTITKQQLYIGHPETRSRDIKYRVTELPQYGTLMMKDLDDQFVENIRRFTQRDVDENKIVYKHTNARYTTDVFLFDVSNGVLTLQGQEFVIEVIPKDIPLEVEGFSIPEGGQKSVSVNNIKIRNRYFQKQDLEYSIVDPPKHGRITYTDNQETDAVKFNHMQVTKRKVMYIHDDSNTKVDNFTLFVRIPGTNYKSDPHTIDINVIPVNDEKPEVVRNEPLWLWIGSSAPITDENLQVIDVDTPDDQIMYIIGNPANGEVTLKDNPTRNILNFTQAHVNSKQVIFRQREEAESYFEFTVTDGEHSTDPMRFIVEAKRLVLSLERLHNLEAYPGILQPITASNMKVVTNDLDSSRPIYYTLQSKPAKGLLVMVLNNGTETEITSFSQDDIQNKRVFYHQNSPMVGWTDTDSFIFEVSTLYADRISHREFDIKISYEYINENNWDQLVKVMPPKVWEGGMVVITKDNLDISKLRRRLTSSGISGSEVSLIVTELPQSGTLFLNNTPVKLEQSLTQQDINSELVTYIHDDSDTLSDAFHFSLDIEIPGQTGADDDSDFDTVFNITVKPKNDQRFDILTVEPNIELVQGFVANITKESLNTVDPDTPPSGLKYDVDSGPNHGQLINIDDYETPVRHFTQQDINDKKIQYLHGGDRNNDAFYFKVSDGKYTSYFKIFMITVHPLTLDLYKINDLHIEQGLFSQYLTGETFGIKTNGNKDLVMYNITRPPSAGQLYMNNQPVSHFNHRNIMNQEITYIQSDAKRSMDDFTFVVYDRENTIRGKSLHIKVIAAMKKGETPPEVPAGEPLVLTLDMLDASHLASITQSNPIYSVTVQPRLGTLRIISGRRMRRDEIDFDTRIKRAMGYYNEPANRIKRALDFDDTRIKRAMDYDDGPAEYFRFTHQDIMEGLVEYEPEEGSITAPETDSFSFILMAKAAQPAHGTFEVTVMPPVVMTTTPKMAGGGATPASGSGAKTTPPEEEPVEGKKTQKAVNGEHLMIVYIVSAVTFTVILLIIIIKCVKHKKKKRRMKMQMAMKEDSKTPLSQPMIQADPDLTYCKQDTPVTSRALSYDSGPRIPAINITPDSEAGSVGSGGSSRQQLPKYNGEFGTVPRLPTARQLQDRGDHNLPPRAKPPRTSSLPKISHSRQQDYSDPRQGYNHGSDYGLDYRDSDPNRVTDPRLEYNRTDPRNYSRTDSPQGYNRPVPTCKVTPLADGEEGGDQLPHDGTRQHVTFNWEKIDPELLQHCRTTNPVLHENKYWV